MTLQLHVSKGERNSTLERMSQPISTVVQHWEAWPEQIYIPTSLLPCGFSPYSLNLWSQVH